MKRDYSKWSSIALITAIYVLAGVAGILLLNTIDDLGYACNYALDKSGEILCGLIATDNNR